MDEFVGTDREIVGRMKIAARKSMTNFALANMEIRVWPDVVMDGLVMSLEGYIAAGGEQRFYREIEAPATWWDHWKDQVGRNWSANPSTFIGRWVRRKWSAVNYARYEVEWTAHARICPHGILSDRPDRWADHVKFVSRGEDYST